MVMLCISFKACVKKCLGKNKYFILFCATARLPTTTCMWLTRRLPLIPAKATLLDPLVRTIEGISTNKDW
jgi:hypothetical protein